MYDNFNLISKVLKKRGYKFTKQRKEILECIYESKEHITIEDIYSIVKVNGVGLSTLYRNLDIFKKCGIISEITIDDTTYYEPRIYKNKSFHIHFKCNKCRNIFDIEDKIVLEKIFDLNLNLQNTNNISIENTNVVLIGVCDCCKNKEEKRKIL